MSRVLAVAVVSGAVSLGGAAQASQTPPSTSTTKAKPSAKKPATAVKAGKVAAKPGVRAGVKSTVHGGAAAVRHAAVATTAATKAATDRVLKLNSAFTASAQLRPMAQQLASTRTAAAYAGVASYAGSHPGAAAATAYLALGHAYGLDRRYGDAADAYKKAGSAAGDSLSDYSDYLGAQALMEANRSSEVFPLLDRFAERHPESIFAMSAPLLLANALVQQKNGAAAVKVLEPMLGTPEADHPEFKYALGRAYQTAGIRPRLRRCIGRSLRGSRWHLRRHSR